VQRPDLPRGLTTEVARDWTALDAATGPSAAFEVASVAGLPEPVRRWLRHAIAEGTPLARSVQLDMRGEIRIGRWAPFTAVQRMSVTDGFVWAATARPLGLPVVGFDRWTRETGAMRWRLFDAVPLISATGEDITRSAAGRHAGELLLHLPTAALSREVDWHGLDSDRAVAVVRVGGDSHGVTLRVGPDGALTELVMQRWGPLRRGSFGWQSFGATLSGEFQVGGLTIPRRVTAGWHYGTDGWPAGQFIRWSVDQVTYR
jgi:hypothetical protein